MTPTAVYARRRARLLELVSGPILIAGHGERPRNLPYNLLPFRQDSTMLYLTGCNRPGVMLWLEQGEATLYAPEPAADDALWHGASEGPEALALALGVDAVLPFSALAQRAQAARPRTLAVADLAVTHLLAAWCGVPLVFGREPGDPELGEAIIRLRRSKGPEEIVAMREAATITARAHELAMRATRPGISERALVALFEAALASRGATPGYATILTQRGEILHMHDHDAVCAAGRLLLLDGGGEVSTGHTADVTRVWPVSGRFSHRQRAAYEAVLEAQQAGIDAARPGVPWREVHLATARVIARFALDEGLLRHLSVDEAVERGAHALFLPHGVGHLIGLDVHDLNNFGDRATYPPGVERSPQFGLSYLRLGLPLEAGWTVTVEPGFYVIPAILADPTIRGPFGHHVDDARLEDWLGFGGIRIEDDVHITETGPDVLTAGTPKSVEAVEALTGSGPTWELLIG